MSGYLVVKFVHVLFAIVAVGSSAGSSPLAPPCHAKPRASAVRPQEREVSRRIPPRPGLIVLLITGLWMAASRWTLALFWIRAALLLVVIVVVILCVVVGPLLRRLIRVAESGEMGSIGASV